MYLNRSVSVFYALVVVYLTSAGTALAAEYEAERQLYRQGIEALKKEQYGDYRFILSRLESYPLYPYLLEAGLRQQIDNKAKHPQTMSFLEKYEGMPVIARLQAKWLDYLEKEQMWETISAMNIPVAQTSQRCVYQKSLYRMNMHENAFENIEKLWTSRLRIPRACEFVVNQWLGSGELSDDLVWQRIFLLLRYSRLEEATKLVTLLSDEEQNLSQLLLILHQQPELLSRLDKYKSSSKYYDQVIQHAVRRLASKDLEQTLDIWSDVQDEHETSDTSNVQTHLYLARKMAYKKHSSASEWFGDVDKQDLSSKDKELMLRIAIGAQDWDEILDTIDTFPPALQQSDRLLYWTARAYEETHQENEAQLIFDTLARRHGYYGFLAADRLSMDYTITNPTEYDVDLESLNTMEDLPDILRARELYMVGQVADARREWQHSSRNFNNKQLLQAAQLSQSWGWHDRAIFALARTPYRDALELRFPLAHEVHISNSAEHNDIEAAWVFALIRQESAFISDARSRTGALGLMQLMPRTARQVGKQLKIRKLRSHDILDVKTNIRLGTNYLSGRYKYFNQHKVLATAAYNAGPHRVKKWLPEAGSVPADVWIDTIPYKETRNYVKNILAYIVIYEQRLGLEPTRISQRMPDILGRDELLAKR